MTYNKISIEIAPWVTEYGCKVDHITLTEVIGGKLSTGTIKFVFAPKFQEQVETEYYGKIKLLYDVPDFIPYEIPFFITDRKIDKHKATFWFTCISDRDFFLLRKHESYEDNCEDLIRSLIPEDDIRRKDPLCISDINGKLKFYMNDSSKYALVNKIAHGYRDQSIFGWGWGGFFIKEIITPEERDTPRLIFVRRATEQNGSISKDYNLNVYNPPANWWEDKEGKYIDEDYTDREAVNIRAIKQHTKIGYMKTGYDILYLNTFHNAVYYGGIYQTYSATLDEIPKYQLGEVVDLKIAEMQKNKIVNFPYKYFLVAGNRFFFAFPESKTRDQGKKMTFTTTFMGLERIGELELGKEKEDDPTSKEETPSYLL